jgi:hypothetical protein
LLLHLLLASLCTVLNASTQANLSSTSNQERMSPYTQSLRSA